MFASSPNLNVPCVVLPDYWVLRWCICDYWLIFNEH